MNSSRIAQLSLLLTAITLAVVLAIALRTTPEPVDNTPVVRAEIEAVGAEIEALRTTSTMSGRCSKPGRTPERPTCSPSASTGSMHP